MNLEITKTGEIKFLDSAIAKAKEKLKRIISLYGDLNGERLKPYYLQSLIEEEIGLECFRKYASAMNELNMDVEEWITL